MKDLSGSKLTLKVTPVFSHRVQSAAEGHKFSCNYMKKELQGNRKISLFDRGWTEKIKRGIRTIQLRIALESTERMSSPNIDSSDYVLVHDQNLTETQKNA